MIHRLPIYSLLAGLIVACVTMVAIVTRRPIPPVGLGAIGLLPIAAAFVDALRMRRRFRHDAETGPDDDSVAEYDIDDSQLREWVQQRTKLLNDRERELNQRALAIQQWMQFPDAIALSQNDATTFPSTIAATSDEPGRTDIDPLEKHDDQLFALIDRKTRELFDDLKQDAYRKDSGDSKVFDNDRIRADLVSLVSDVAAIYRPDDPSPLLRTNIEALSRASGRAALRLLVAVESLPGGISSYDFQTIYNVVIRAVQTYGMYKSAKPYLDVASGLLFAGRIASTTNPVTLVAWYAASKATTYGASKLGSHVIDQQAVGLIRQLVEVVSLEIASLYSPMVRYRDANWIYGVELVQLAHELSLSDQARSEAMRQLAALQLRDEYGRVSLMRQLANQSTSRPNNYRPAESLSAEERMLVAQKLEVFLLSNVLHDPNCRSDKSTIQHWQDAVADRLDIQFRSEISETDVQSQRDRVIVALASFALEHLSDEPDIAVERLSESKCWKAADKETQKRWRDQLQADPPFLYQPPVIDPDSELCRDFLDDLIELASVRPVLSEESPTERMLPGTQLSVPTWPGHSALQVTAYFLRADARKYVERYRKDKIRNLMSDQDLATLSSIPPGLIDTLLFLSGGKKIATVFSPAQFETSNRENAFEDAFVVVIDQRLICFSMRFQTPVLPVELIIHGNSERSDVQMEKMAGYIRSDCRLHFPGVGYATITGSKLKSYDSYFGALLAKP